MASKCLRERPQALFTFNLFLVFFSLLSSLQSQFSSNAGLFHRLSLVLPVGLAFVESLFEFSCRLEGLSIENTGGRNLEPALCSETLQGFSILQAKFKRIRNYSPSWAFSFVRRSNNKRQSWENLGQSCLLLLEGTVLQRRIISAAAFSLPLHQWS